MKVRANSIYRFNGDYFMDRNAQMTNGVRILPGDLVRVVNLYGCPPANTMGQCYVEFVDAPKGCNPRRNNAFCMVSTSSLEKP